MGQVSGCDDGKIIGLHSTLREYGAFIEYDMLARGMDIRDLFRGRISFRRMILIIERLAEDPTTSLHRKLVDGWTRQDQLLAASVDEARYGHYLFGAANTPKGKPNPIPMPPRIERPGVTNENTSGERVVKKFGQTTKSREEIEQLLASFDPIEE